MFKALEWLLDSFLFNAILAIPMYILACFLANQNPLNDGIGTTMIVFGACWLVTSVFSLIFHTLECTVRCIAASILIIIVGGCIHYYLEKPKEDPTDAEMGNTEKAEWLLTFTYDTKSGITEKIEKKYVGKTSNAENKLQEMVRMWNEKNQENKAYYIEKMLLYIPKTYAKEHGYPEGLSQRYD